MKPNQDDVVFWDRLFDMPDIEAIHELRIRKDDLVLQKAVLHGEKANATLRDANLITQSLIENDALITKINAETKMRNLRMDRTAWRNAVRAVYGDEGVEKCVVWIQTQL
jgi:hypothetical protein